MRRIVFALGVLCLAVTASARGDGLLVPTDRSLPPLSLTHQRVNVQVEGQVATTAVEQVFRNATGRDLEADYLFPLPPGASVREFAMWVGGKKLTGETIEASKARHTYEDIVRRLKDPGLLEYVDRDLWKVRIFPVPHFGEQKIEIKFTTLLPKEGDLVSYVYPLRSGQANKRTERDFTMVVRIDSEDPLGPVYSPSHDVAIDRRGENKAVVSFERSGYTLDRDFQLYFAPRTKDVGLSLLTHRESHHGRGYFLLLLSPRSESDVPQAPRDLVVVLDTSHSMTGEKIKQAKGALNAALDSLNPDDRFALIQFATVVTPFRDSLQKATRDNIDDARAWVKKLEAQGATDIGSALEEALKLRPRHGDSDGRTFQVVFFTDGLPTAGLSSPQILKLVGDKDTQAVRIFTFGVGDDVDAHLLDQLAEATRAASSYVRPNENLEAKASALVAKISHPVRTDLRLKVGDGVRLVEMYPPKLPDLFRGEQLQVAGRYEGEGHVALTLESQVGERHLSDTFEVKFPEVADGHDFIPPVWARRKVGYLLDQIRLHGEKGELKDEVIRLAREFGIATPYTSMLVVPDDHPYARGGGMPLYRQGGLGRDRDEHAPAYGLPAGVGGGGLGAQMQGQSQGSAATDFALHRRARARNESVTGAAIESKPALAGRHNDQLGLADEAEHMPARPESRAGGRPNQNALAETAQQQAFEGLSTSGKDAVDLAQQLAKLKTEGRVEESQAVKNVAGHHFVQVGGAWVDDRFQQGTKTLRLKAFGASYFRLLADHKELKAIFALGDRVVWVAPSGTALVIANEGEDEVNASTLEALFKPASSR